MMEINWTIIAIFGGCIIGLVVFLAVKNAKDKRDVIRFLNSEDKIDEESELNNEDK